MISEYAIEKTLVYYILVVMLLAVNLYHIDVVWLKIVNIIVLSFFSGRYYLLHKAWTNLKYKQDNHVLT